MTKEKELEFAWRDKHIGRLLFEIQKDYQERAIKTLQNSGYTDISLAHINIIASIHIKGSRSIEIAKGLDISKQAVGQMVKELISKGYLKRQADPNDGRATLVSFTTKGKQLLETAQQSIMQTEETYANWLGQEQFQQVKTSLKQILEQLKDAKP